MLGASGSPARYWVWLLIPPSFYCGDMELEVKRDHHYLVLVFYISLFREVPKFSSVCFLEGTFWDCDVWKCWECALYHKFFVPLGRYFVA